MAIPAAGCSGIGVPFPLGELPRDAGLGGAAAAAGAWSLGDCRSEAPPARRGASYEGGGRTLGSCRMSLGTMMVFIICLPARGICTGEVRCSKTDDNLSVHSVIQSPPPESRIGPLTLLGTDRRWTAIIGGALRRRRRWCRQHLQPLG